MTSSKPQDRRDRSRSPYRGDEAVEKHRSRSPTHKHRRHHHHHKSSASTASVKLPFRQKPLHKSDLEDLRPLLANYLDVQKSLNIAELSEDEVKGRWKSFLGKWNRKELSEGWYDPEMRERAGERYGSVQRRGIVTRDEGVDEEDDDGYGPALPSKNPSTFGPVLPKLDGLQHRQDLAEEDRSAHLSDLRFSRKQDRSAQKERLEELVPRADPGSRERQLEKKRDTAAVVRDFRDAKEAGDVEVGESELMGDDSGFKANLKKREKLKNEREVRREEILRAREAEREERMRGFRAKEEKTMDMLKEIARERFGRGRLVP